jgi:tetratricopeptide (TPR) repeat protein
VQRARQALEIDPTNWRASSLLAQASRDPPLSSVAILKPVIHRLGSDKDWQQSDLNRAGLSTMFFILAEKTHKENFNEAINFAKSAIRIQPTDYSRISRFLQRCADKREWQLYVELLEAMCDSSKALEEQALNELMILCVFDMHQTEHFPTMLQAGLYTGRLQFIVDALGECAEMLETRGDRARLCHLRYHYGRGLHALHSGSPKALEQWRKAIEEGASPDLLSALIGNIAPYYLQKATKAAAANDDETASINLERIDTLLPEDIPKSSVMLLPAMYLIRYHVRKGDRAQAELLADEIVGRGIETLTDDIEDNDLPAYRELMWLFVALGDEQNVNAIRSLIIARFSDHRHANCDGDCGGSLDTADEMVWCQDCVNVKFEEKCYGKLHEVGFPLLFCNSTHEVLRLPKIDRPEDGHVLIGGGMVRVAEWIQSIQRRYSSAKQRSWENQDRSQIRATT